MTYPHLVVVVLNERVLVFSAELLIVINPIAAIAFDGSLFTLPAITSGPRHIMWKIVHVAQYDGEVYLTLWFFCPANVRVPLKVAKSSIWFPQ